MGKLDLDLAKLGNLPVNWPKLLLLRPFQNGLANVFRCVCARNVILHNFQ